MGPGPKDPRHRASRSHRGGTEEYRKARYWGFDLEDHAAAPNPGFDLFADWDLSQKPDQTFLVPMRKTGVPSSANAPRLFDGQV